MSEAMTETAEMQEAEPVAWRYRVRNDFFNGWNVSLGPKGAFAGFSDELEWEPLYSQSDFDAMRAQRDEWEAAAMQARDGCNQRSDTIRSLRNKLATLQAQITRLREALKPFAEYMNDGGDLDDKGCPLTDDQGPGWVYLTIADFRRARAALSEPSPSNSGDTPNV